MKEYKELTFEQLQILPVNRYRVVLTFCAPLTVYLACDCKACRERSLFIRLYHN